MLSPSQRIGKKQKGQDFDDSFQLRSFVRSCKNRTQCRYTFFDLSYLLLACFASCTVQWAKLLFLHTLVGIEQNMKCKSSEIRLAQRPRLRCLSSTPSLCVRYCRVYTMSRLIVEVDEEVASALRRKWAEFGDDAATFQMTLLRAFMSGTYKLAADSEFFGADHALLTALQHADVRVACYGASALALLANCAPAAAHAALQRSTGTLSVKKEALRDASFACKLCDVLAALLLERKAVRRGDPATAKVCLTLQKTGLLAVLPAVLKQHAANNDVTELAAASVYALFTMEGVELSSDFRLEASSAVAAALRRHKSDLSIDFAGISIIGQTMRDGFDAFRRLADDGAVAALVHALRANIRLDVTTSAALVEIELTLGKYRGLPVVEPLIRAGIVPAVADALLHHSLGLASGEESDERVCPPASAIRIALLLARGGTPSHKAKLLDPALVKRLVECAEQVLDIEPWRATAVASAALADTCWTLQLLAGVPESEAPHGHPLLRDSSLTRRLITLCVKAVQGPWAGSSDDDACLAMYRLFGLTAALSAHAPLRDRLLDSGFAPAVLSLLSRRAERDSREHAFSGVARLLEGICRALLAIGPLPADALRLTARHNACLQLLAGLAEELTESTEEKAAAEAGADPLPYIRVLYIAHWPARVYVSLLQSFGRASSPDRRLPGCLDVMTVLVSCIRHGNLETAAGCVASLRACEQLFISGLYAAPDNAGAAVIAALQKAAAAVAPCAPLADGSLTRSGLAGTDAATTDSSERGAASAGGVTEIPAVGGAGAGSDSARRAGEDGVAAAPVATTAGNVASSSAGSTGMTLLVASEASTTSTAAESAAFCAEALQFLSAMASQPYHRPQLLRLRAVPAVVAVLARYVSSAQVCEAACDVLASLADMQPVLDHDGSQRLSAPAPNELWLQAVQPVVAAHGSEAPRASASALNAMAVSVIVHGGLIDSSCGSASEPTTQLPRLCSSDVVSFLESTFHSRPLAEDLEGPVGFLLRVLEVADGLPISADARAPTARRPPLAPTPAETAIAAAAAAASFSASTPAAAAAAGSSSAASDATPLAAAAARKRTQAVWSWAAARGDIVALRAAVNLVNEKQFFHSLSMWRFALDFAADAGDAAMVDTVLHLRAESYMAGFLQSPQSLMVDNGLRVAVARRNTDLAHRLLHRWGADPTSPGGAAAALWMAVQALDIDMIDVLLQSPAMVAVGGQQRKERLIDLHADSCHVRRLVDLTPARYRGEGGADADAGAGADATAGAGSSDGAGPGAGSGTGHDSGTDAERERALHVAILQRMLLDARTAPPPPASGSEGPAAAYFSPAPAAGGVRSPANSAWGRRFRAAADSALSFWASQGHYFVVQALLEDPRVDPTILERDMSLLQPTIVTNEGLRRMLLRRPSTLRQLVLPPPGSDAAAVAAASLRHVYSAADVAAMGAAAWRRRRAAVLAWEVVRL